MAKVTEGLFPQFAGLLTQQPQYVQGGSSPMGAVSNMITGQTNRLLGSVGQAFGQQTPQQQLQGIVQQAQQEADLATPQGLTVLADRLNQIPQFSGIALSMRQQAAQMAQQQKESEAGIGFKEAQAAQMKAKAQAGPKDERSPEKKKMDELIEQGVPVAEARSIAYKTQSVDFRRELDQEKKEAKKQSKLEQQQSTITTIDNVVNKVDEALKLVSPYTAGAGSIFNIIPGTSAKDLATTVETVKANLGFDRLQRMRDASPTGGALGQVAVQELVALQSSVASLDVSQSPAQLKKNLENVKRHYENWRKAILDSQAQGQQPQQGQQGGEVQRPSTATPPIAPEQTQKPVVRFIRDAQGNIVRQ